jgi:PAS domain S-box-containing protein
VSLADAGRLAARALAAADGAGGVVDGLDYRGAPALGVARPVAGSDWVLLAKLDRAEAYAGAAEEALWIALTGLLALFMAGVGLHAQRQRQQLALAAVAQQAQAERLRALQLLDAIAEGSDDAIFAKDLEGRYLLFNRAAGHFVGQDPAVVLGRDDRALFPPDQAELLMGLDRRVVAEGRIGVTEEALDTAGGPRVFLATKGPLRDAEGRVIGTFGIARDITGRKAMEQALRDNEARFRDIVEASADWVWEVDAGGCYT